MKSLQNDVQKRAEGRYYTIHNPFNHPAFRIWAREAGLPGATILEPFAGAAHLLRALEAVGLGGPWAAYDIAPANPSALERNSLIDFLSDSDVIVTNPPYLARNSAVRRGLSFPRTEHPDLYLHCFELCLTQARFVAAIIPDSFFQAGCLQERCRTLISLPFPMFSDTEHPVCLALFRPEPSHDIEVWNGTHYLGPLSLLRQALPNRQSHLTTFFNVPNGTIGLLAVDGTLRPSISFIPGDEIPSNQIKPSSRSRTRIAITEIKPNDIPMLIATANLVLDEVRAKTGDVFFTAFKGVRADGRFRRRLDFTLARLILNEAAIRSGLVSEAS